MSNYTSIAISKKTESLINMAAKARGTSKSKLVDLAVNKFLKKEDDLTVGVLMDRIGEESGLSALRLTDKPKYSPVTDDDIYEALKDELPD